WDTRDKELDPRDGHYIAATATPFLGFGTTGSGAQVTLDARGYRTFGRNDGLVLAGRAQLGSVLGAALLETPPDYLFFSGGAGTVRGQAYQSRGVPVEVSPGVTVDTGGRSFLGLSGEIRADVTETVSAVGFVDAGYIGAGSLGGSGRWHSGAGLGLRYDTGIGPIRLDVAAPLSGNTGDGVQFYLGIGQSF